MTIYLKEGNSLISLKAKLMYIKHNNKADAVFALGICVILLALFFRVNFVVLCSLLEEICSSYKFK